MSGNEARLVELAVQAFALACARSDPNTWPRRELHVQTNEALLSKSKDEGGPPREDGHAGQTREDENDTRRCTSSTICNVSHENEIPPLKNYSLRLQANSDLTQCVTVLDNEAAPLPDSFWDAIAIHMSKQSDNQRLRRRVNQHHQPPRSLNEHTQSTQESIDLLDSPESPMRDGSQETRQDKQVDDDEVLSVLSSPRSVQAAKHGIALDNINDDNQDTLTQINDHAKPSSQDLDTDVDNEDFHLTQTNASTQEKQDGELSDDEVLEPRNSVEHPTPIFNSSLTATDGGLNREAGVTTSESQSDDAAPTALLSEQAENSNSIIAATTQVGTPRSSLNTKTLNNIAVKEETLETENFNGDVKECEASKPAETEEKGGTEVLRNLSCMSEKSTVPVLTPHMPAADSPPQKIAPTLDSERNPNSSTPPGSETAQMSSTEELARTVGAEEAEDNTNQVTEDADQVDLPHPDAPQVLSTKKRQASEMSTLPPETGSSNSDSKILQEEKKSAMGSPMKKRRCVAPSLETFTDVAVSAHQLDSTGILGSVGQLVNDDNDSDASSTATVAARPKTSHIMEIDPDGPNDQLKCWLDVSSQPSPVLPRLPSMYDYHQQDLPQRDLQQSGSEKLYALSRWPAMLKRRSFAYKMPPPTKQYRGQTIILWVQIGGVLGEASSCVRFDDNWALGLALWLHGELKLPIMCITFLSHAMHDACIERSSESQTNIFRDQAFLFSEMESQLKRWNIPLMGLYCDPGDVTSVMASYTRAVRAHIVLVPESYSPPAMLLLRNAARAIPCPLFSIDSDCILPPRYVNIAVVEQNTPGSMDLNSAEEADHKLSLSREVGHATSELEWSHFVPCLSPVPIELTENILTRSDGVILVPKKVYDRWNLAEIYQFRAWLEDTKYKPRSSVQLAEENLTALLRSEDAFRRKQLEESLLAHLRQGVISPISVARRLQKAPSELMNSIVFEREHQVLRAYRQYKTVISKWDFMVPTEVQPLKFASEDAEPASVLSGDLAEGNSPDLTWNTIHRRILSDGIIWNESTNMQYWVERIAQWIPRADLGVYLVLRWAATYLLGGQAADFFMKLTANIPPEALCQALSLQRTIKTPRKKTRLDLGVPVSLSSNSSLQA